MIRPPSLQKPFDLVVSGDDALDRPARGDAMSDAEWETIDAAWRERVRAARDSGQWADLIRPGCQPTLFTVRPLAGSVGRLMQDDAAAGRIGDSETFALVFRSCIQSIAHLPEPFKLEFETHPRYGKMARASVVDMLDAVGPAIVLELGYYLLMRSAAPPGK